MELVFSYGESSITRETSSRQAEVQAFGGSIVCDNTELIKCARNGQASAVLKDSKRVVYDFLVSLRNACPSSLGWLGGAWVPIVRSLPGQTVTTVTS
jgi:hypothetical protein